MIEPNNGTRNHPRTQLRSAPRTLWTRSKLQADTILENLLPEELIEIAHIKRIQSQVLRAIQAIIVPINICIQATDCNAAVIECRELVDEVSEDHHRQGGRDR